MIALSMLIYNRTRVRSNRI